MNDAIKQAIDALEAACGDRCNAEYNPCQAREAIKALRAQPDLESRDFYELMQGYRHSGWDAAPSFEAVKAWLRNPTYKWGEQ